MGFLNKIYKSLRENSFIGWFLLTSLLPLLIALFLVNSITNTALKEKIIDKLSAVSDQKIGEIERYLRETEKIVALMSNNPWVKEDLVKISDIQKGGKEKFVEYEPLLEKLRVYSKSVVDLYGYSDIFLFNTAGEPVFALNFPQIVTQYKGKLFDKELGRISGKNPFDNPNKFVDRELDSVLDRAKTLLEPQISELIYTDQYFKPQIYIATPIFEKGSVLGSLVIQMNNDFIKYPLQDYSGLGDTGETLMGFIRAETIEPVIDLRFTDILGFMASSKDMDSNMENAFVEATLGVKSSGTMRDYRGKEVLAVTRYVPSLGWGFLTKVDTDEAYKPMQKLKQDILLLTFLTTIGASILAYLISRMLQTARDKLTNVLNDLELAQGEVEHANKAKSQFLSNMSHELRTPLNAVIGYSEMVAEDLLEKGLSELIPDITKINTSGKHLLSLINEILDISKIEAGKMEVFFEQVDLRKLLSDIEIIIGPLVAKNYNMFILKIESDVDYMYTDSTKLKQCLLNLIGNASKFTNNGTIKLIVSEFIQDERKFIRFDVVDTGIGIEKENLNKLFKAFSQVDGSKMQGGTGLGLYLTQKFCYLMGGSTAVSSKINEGSTFSIILPENSDDKTKQIFHLNLPENRLKKVLIIEDDRDAQTNMQNVFKDKTDFEIFQAFNGETGLQYAQEYLPDVIILDILLPGIDGWEVLAQLKANPKLAHIPVIMQSKLSPEVFAYSRGVADYLVKPVSGHDLIKHINKTIVFKDIHHVLVVDDDYDARHLMVSALQKVGLNVEEASNGLEALEKIQHNKPSLILLDIMMPKMNGFEVVERLQASPQWSEIPVVILTSANLSIDELDRLKQLSLKVFRKSNYSKGDLIEQVNSILKLT